MSQPTLSCVLVRVVVEVGVGLGCDNKVRREGSQIFSISYVPK